MVRITERKNYVAHEAKKNDKKFWKYVKSELTTTANISDLEDESDESKNLYTTNIEKAQILSNFLHQSSLRKATPMI